MIPPVHLIMAAMNARKNNGCDYGLADTEEIIEVLGEALAFCLCLFIFSFCLTIGIESDFNANKYNYNMYYKKMNIAYRNGEYQQSVMYGDSCKKYNKLYKEDKK